MEECQKIPSSSTWDQLHLEPVLLPVPLALTPVIKKQMIKIFFLSGKWTLTSSSWLKLCLYVLKFNLWPQVCNNLLVQLLTDAVYGYKTFWLSWSALCKLADKAGCNLCSVHRQLQAAALPRGDMISSCRWQELASKTIEVMILHKSSSPSGIYCWTEDIWMHQSIFMCCT